MKGHIFNLLEEYLIECAGISAYEDILSGCQFATDAGFISTVNYPEEHLTELVESATDRLGISVAAAHLGFGRWLLPYLAKLVPSHMANHKHPQNFLRAVGYIHQVELKKLYPDAKPPTFSYRQINRSQGVLSYSSPRAMFDLVEGVLHGVADYFNTEMTITRKPRQDLGGSCCDFIIHYHN